MSLVRTISTAISASDESKQALSEFRVLVRQRSGYNLPLLSCDDKSQKPKAKSRGHSYVPVRLQTVSDVRLLPRCRYILP